MSLTKIRLGTKEDGTPLYHYNCPDGHVVVTGPSTGTVETADGTKYDVTDEVIEVDSHDHAVEVADLLDQRQASESAAPVDGGAE